MQRTTSEYRKRISANSNLNGTIIIILFLSCLCSFLAGIFLTLTLVGFKTANVPTVSYSPITGNISSTLQNEARILQGRIQDLEKNQKNEIERLLNIRLKREIDKHCGNARVLENEAEHAVAAANSKSLFPTETVGRFAVAMARTSKQEFVDSFEMGVPIDPPGPGSDEVLFLYGRQAAVPTLFGDDHNKIPELAIHDAIENCHYVNILLTDHSGLRNQCVAIVPQYESYHLQKWMRVDAHGALDPTQPLQMVSRGQVPSGKDHFSPPELKFHTRKHWSMLQRYFENVDDVLTELHVILNEIAVNKTVIVMVCNFGQAQLLTNFVCSAKARNFDLSNIIVFTTDEETTEIVTALGLRAYFDHRNFGNIPKMAAKRYGDAKFVAMMMAKVICVQLVSMLGFNFLFQDVDIVWFRHPMEYFTSEKLGNYDVFFQDDGGHSVRYAPYSANSGFYYVKHNKRTRHFLTSLLMAGDLILKTDSHQQALIATLNEHVSLFGLKAKVLSRLEEEFPGGYQFHQKSKDYMTKFFKGIYKPYIFHMSWTMNKDNKLLFFRQMGEWYVNDKCIDKRVNDTQLADSQSYSEGCCSAQPLFSCHYRDKPSVKPCKSSPPIDQNKKSWWP